MEKQQNKPFKIKLHPMLDEKELNAISDATLAAIDDQLCKLPRLTENDIGKEIKNEGIYLGTYAPVDRDGVSLKKVFNVFAAPEDLPETRKYAGTMKYITNLKNWHGHDGTNYATDKKLYAALKDGTYKGGWIIPTREILIGTEADGPTGQRASTAVVVQPDNLYDHREKGAFKGTFCTKAASGSNSPDRYWSSTLGPVNSSYVYFVSFSDGEVGWISKDGERLSCRPVRLVERVL